MEVKLMSRIGKLPVTIPDKVDVSINGHEITVKGPKGELKDKINENVDLSIKDNEIIVERRSDEKYDRSLHGLVRSLIQNMVIGVSEGYEKKLEMVGVGYNAKLKGSDLEIEAGYSHPVIIKAPEDISFNVEKNNKITVSGINKQEVGDIAAKIRDVRKPEPYKGKGIKYIDEHIRRKVGKTG